jgi:hypothetical protein
VKGELFKLLDAPARTGMASPSFAMTPAAAVSGFYFAHPDAHYFAVSKIGRDQLEDWAQRTGMRWPKPSAGWRRCCKPAFAWIGTCKGCVASCALVFPCQSKKSCR